MVVLTEKKIPMKEKFQFIQNQGWKNPDNNSNEISLFNAVHLSMLMWPFHHVVREWKEGKLFCNVIVLFRSEMGILRRSVHLKFRARTIF